MLNLILILRLTWYDLLNDDLQSYPCSFLKMTIALPSVNSLLIKLLSVKALLLRDTSFILLHSTAKFIKFFEFGAFLLNVRIADRQKQ